MSIKKIIFGWVVFLYTLNLSAQQYNHLPSRDIVKDAVLNDVNVYNIQQKIGNTPVVFKWRKLSVSMPSSWEASICDLGHCYTSVVDSSIYDTAYTGDLGIISLHLNPKTEYGTGKVMVEIFDIKTPTKKDTLTWTITAKATSSILGSPLQNNFSVNFYTNQIEIQSLKRKENYYQIYNIDGKLISKALIDKEFTHITTSSFAKGIYFLTIIDNNQVIYSQRFLTY